MVTQLRWQSFIGECQKLPEAVVHRCSSKIGALKNFVYLIGKHLNWSLFLKKLQVAVQARCS